MIKKVLVGIDGSEPALKAVRMACEIAAATNGEVTLAYVTSSGTVSPDKAIIEAHEGIWVERLMREAVDTASESRVKVEKTFLHGSAAEAIADHAASKDFDLVVVGSRGRGAVSRMLMGSVTDRLVHICKKPVLVVR